MSTQPMMFPSEWSERMAYKRAKAVYWPYDIEDLRHFCALRDLRIEELKADNAKLRKLLLDCWDFSHLMHEAMAARFYELGLIGDGEARELGVEVES